MRAPIQDDVLLLTKPTVGTSGRVYTKLLVPEGTATYVLVIGYNSRVLSLGCHCWRVLTSLISRPGTRIQLWGLDTYEFRPEHWLEMKERVESPIGVYGNLYGHLWSSHLVVEY